MATHSAWFLLEPFKHLSAAGKRLLSEGLSTVEPERSAPVLHKGQPVSGAYLVMSGRLRVFTIAPNGTEATLYFINPGETCVLALNCLFNDLAYPAWVQAESASHVAVIPGAIYRKLFESEPIIQNLTVHALSTIIYRLMSELEQVHSSGHRERLIHFILTQASDDRYLHMTQQEIAQHLGTTREVIARLLRELVGKKLVRTQRGSMCVVDRPGLERAIAVKCDGK